MSSYPTCAPSLHSDNPSLATLMKNNADRSAKCQYLQNEMQNIVAIQTDLETKREDYLSEKKYFTDLGEQFLLDANQRLEAQRQDFLILSKKFRTRVFDLVTMKNQYVAEYIDAEKNDENQHKRLNKNQLKKRKRKERQKLQQKEEREAHLDILQEYNVNVPPNLAPGDPDYTAHFLRIIGACFYMAQTCRPHMLHSVCVISEYGEWPESANMEAALEAFVYILNS